MTDEEQTFGRLAASLLQRLRQGDMHAADMLWDVGTQLEPDKRQQLEKLVHAELDKLDQ